MVRRVMFVTLFCLLLVLFYSFVTLRDQYFCQSSSKQDERIFSKFNNIVLVCSEFRQKFNCRTTVATPLNIDINIKLGYDTKLLFKVFFSSFIKI